MQIATEILVKEGHHDGLEQRTIHSIENPTAPTGK